MATDLKPIARRLLGRRSDWHLTTPDLHLPRPSLAWLGTLAVVASVVASWFAFNGAMGEEGGSVQLGLFVGAASILLMAWSFLLAVRIRVLEPFFGGLDSMYRVHRWAGSLAVVLMFWHVRLEPEVEGGIRGASKSIADTAEGLAGVGEYMLYGLILISLLRVFPYRFWRWTHKLLGVPFIFASWHFFTAEKTYANGSPWGWWFATFMVGGILAWVWRVVGRDMVAQGARHRVTHVEVTETATVVDLDPIGQPLGQGAGQFAFLKFQLPGLSEPHPFTVASAPGENRLRFVIRDRGDWSAALRTADLAGAEVIVEGPYGTFAPFGSEGQPCIWIAGGVGITPFLGALDIVPPGTPPPDLFYAMRSADDLPIMEQLRAADAAGKIRLHEFSSALGDRLTPERFLEAMGGQDLSHHYIAMCGPPALLRAVAGAARTRGASHFHAEDFDIRQGFGPDVDLTTLFDQDPSTQPPVVAPLRDAPATTSGATNT